jgi:glycine betaine/proline transport system permease protein
VTTTSTTSTTTTAARAATSTTSTSGTGTTAGTAGAGARVWPVASGRVRRIGVRAAVVVAAVVAGASAGREVPSWLDSHVQEWARDTYRWTIENAGRHWLFTRVFDPVKDVVSNLVDATLWLLRNLRWPGVVAIIGGVGWRVGSGRAAIAGTAAMLGVGVLGVWDAAMITMALMIVSVAFALLIGVPLGVWSARSDRVERVLRTVLDTAQVMPAFVYLIPLVVMFGIGDASAVIATVIYGAPPAVRLTNLGLRTVPVVANEVAGAFGCTSRQQLFKVQLPLARRSIMLGLNQVIMMSFGIVVIASLIGVGGLGRDVLAGLQKNDVGAAFVPGLAIVLIAVALDRVSTGERGPAPTRNRTDISRRPLWPAWLASARLTPSALTPAVLAPSRLAVAAPAALLLVVLVGRGLGADTFPSSLTVELQGAVNDLVDWASRNMRTGVPVVGGTQNVNDHLVVDVLEPMRRFLVWLPWLVIVVAFVSIGWASKGWKLAAVCAACLVGIASMGTVPVGTSGATRMWDLAMDTLSQVIVAIVLSVLIAVPLGIWAGRSDRVDAIFRPFLDVAQVMPQFVYLIPVISLFNPGRGAGIVASVIYAVPPGIRLTSLGLREVPRAPREAAVAFGASPRQELWKVQLPMAARSILLGVNQTVLMVLATVIIASLVGAGALGLEALGGLNKPIERIGRGLAAGLSIVLLAIVLDRITQAWGKGKEQQ